MRFNIFLTEEKKFKESFMSIFIEDIINVNLWSNDHKFRSINYSGKNLWQKQYLKITNIMVSFIN
jgi:hypothetical protein